jgi:transaldolase
MDSRSGGQGRAVTDVEQLRVQIFADGADRARVLELRSYPWVKGFTTNPTLMRAAGVDNYEGFARELLKLVPDLPVSLEVFSDEFEEMERQAVQISSWGDNVWVKVPVTNTRGEPSGELVRRLAARGVQLNVTALMTVRQVEQVSGWLTDAEKSFVSVFAGRIADTGRDPVPIMADALNAIRSSPQIRLIWAGPREVLNVVQADAIGCHVITLTQDLFRRLRSLGRDLDEFSLETVQMFHRDAEAAGYRLTSAPVSRPLTI